LAEKISSNAGFGGAWFALVLVVLTFIGWPIRNIALVCWVRGFDAYFKNGIRILPGKPTRLSDGEVVKNLPDLVTGLIAFLTTFILMVLFFELFLRLFDRSGRNKQNLTGES